MKNYFCYITIGFLAISCRYDRDTVDESIEKLKLQTLPEVVHPADNPSSSEKILLGKMLFFDPILSGEKDVACATCHHPDFGYTDNRDLPIGVRGLNIGPDRYEGASGIPVVGRNAPTVLNAAYNGMHDQHQSYDPLRAPMFWDSRRSSLEFQALGPPTSFNEMRGSGYDESLTFDSITERLKNIPQYVTLFDNAFGGGANSITEENLGKAIACFERTIVAKNSPYDQYVQGNKSALTDQQKKGLKLFFGKASCGTCHSGPMFSDYNFYNLGIENNSKRNTDTGLDKTFKFRTPTLRNLTVTAPYMHNGTHATLRDVMDYYNNGVSKNPEANTIDVKIFPLKLTNTEVDDVISFLEALTDTDYDKSIPVTVPSGLTPGGN